MLLLYSVQPCFLESLGVVPHFTEALVTFDSFVYLIGLAVTELNTVYSAVWCQAFFMEVTCPLEILCVLRPLILRMLTLVRTWRTFLACGFEGFYSGNIVDSSPVFQRACYCWSISQR